jgi:transposase
LNPLYVGIDVSSKNNVAYLMKPDGAKHSSFSVQNNRGGAKLMSERIVSALTTMQLSDVVIGLEATSIYGDSLVYALREDSGLGRFQRKIHILNPKLVRKFKEAYPDLPKNDFVDAFVIADHLRFGRIASEVYMDDYRYKALQTLTRARFYAVQNLTREKQRFANYLFMKCSGLAQGKVLSQNTSATTIALMEQFETVDDLAYIDLNELTVFITKSGRGRFSDPASTAKAVQTAAKGSYRLPKTVNDSVNQAMSVSIAAMRALESQIKTLDKAIEQQFEIIPNTLTSIPGIGKCIRRALSPRSATSTAFSLRPLLPSLPALSGLSTSPATTRRRIPT